MKIKCVLSLGETSHALSASAISAYVRSFCAIACMGKQTDRKGEAYILRFCRTSTRARGIEYTDNSLLSLSYSSVCRLTQRRSAAAISSYMHIFCT